MFRVLFTIALLLPVDFLNAQVGSVDPSFNVYDDGSYGNLQGLVGNAYVMKPDGNGNIYVGGSLTSFNGVAVNNLIRITMSGALDVTFNTGSGFDSDVNDIIVQGNKVVVGGMFSTYNGSTANKIIRLNADGTVDGTFNMGTGFSGSSVRSFDVDASGQIYVAGSFSAYNGFSQGGLVRLQSDGTVDPTFAIPAGLGSWVYDVLVQSNNKVIVGGVINNYNTNLNGVVRFNSDGSLDTAFDSQLDFNSSIAVVYEAPNGNLYFGGTFTSIGGSTSIQEVARYDANGILDATFNVNPINTGNVRGVLEIGGEVYIAGASQYTQKTTLTGNVIANHNESGNYCMIYLSGDLLLGGTGGMFRVDPSTMLEELLIEGGGASSGGIAHIHMLSGDKILIAGSFEYFNGFPNQEICRLFPDGTVDSTFISPIYNTLLGGTQDMAVMPNGKIVLSGSVKVGGNFYDLVRLNPNGSMDTTFTPIPSTSGGVTLCAVQPDGKICYIKSITSTSYEVIRVNTDGSPDLTFNFAGSLDGGQVKDIVVRSDGKIFVGGFFDTYNGQTVEALVALNSDGTPDLAFNSSIQSQMIYHLSFDSQDRLMVAGNIAGTGQTLNRINTNNTIDASFTFGSSPTITAVNVQNDNKILYVVKISASSYVLRRTLTDGTTDSSWPSNVSINAAITDVKVNSYNQVICSGGFDTYSNFQKNGLTRLFNDVVYGACFYFEAAIDSVQDSGCGSLGYVSVNGYNGVGPNSYQWIPSSLGTSPLINVSQQGVYTCVINDSIGCMDTISAVINGPTTNSNFDLNTNVISDNFRPGVQTYMWVEAINEGCQPVTGQLQLVLDTLVSFVNATPYPDTIIGDTLIWDYTNITFDSVSLIPIVQVMTPFGATVGDTVCFTSMVTPVAGDSNALNNVKEYCFEILNGYDPNDKKVYPVGECVPHYVVNTDPLTYTIRFQNTGNSEAINIYLLDTLDLDLDPQSVNVISHSDPVIAEIIDDRILKFRFDNIYLPDSLSDPMGSKGYIVYQVTPKVSAPLGAEIYNNAGIYFDFNPPIITNTVMNTLSDGNFPYSQGDTLDVNAFNSYVWEGDTYTQSGLYTSTYTNMYGCDSVIYLNLTVTVGLPEINGVEGIDVLMYPNPSSDNIFFVSDRDLLNARIHLIDVRGEIILQRDFKDQIDVSRLSRGIYFIKITLDQELIYTGKLVKE